MSATPLDSSAVEILGVGSLILRGRYRIEGSLGEGGMAMIYRAHDLRFERDVVVKILKPHMVDVDERIFERFMREASAVAQNAHGNTAAIYDIGMIEPQGLPCIVMDYIKGHDLDEELTEFGPMEAARALRLFRSSLEALAVCHKQGVVHKDLKPANLMIRDPRTPYEALIVIDFGVAHFSDEGERLTEEGYCVGTPSYFPPEYINEQAVSPALDVYQMGLVLIEMLTGFSVLQGAVIDRVEINREGLWARIPQIVADSPHPVWRHAMIKLMNGPLWPVMGKALAYDPADRYEDAAAFICALDASQQGVDQVRTARIKAPGRPSSVPTMEGTIPILVTAPQRSQSAEPTVRAAMPHDLDPALPMIERAILALVVLAVILFGGLIATIWSFSPNHIGVEDLQVGAAVALPSAIEAPPAPAIPEPPSAPAKPEPPAPSPSQGVSLLVPEVGDGVFEDEASRAPTEIVPDENGSDGFVNEIGSDDFVVKIFEIIPNTARVMARGEQLKGSPPALAFSDEDPDKIKVRVWHPLYQTQIFKVARGGDPVVRLILKPKPLRVLEPRGAP